MSIERVISLGKINQIVNLNYKLTQHSPLF
jgi:hypothetical protein